MALLGIGSAGRRISFFEFISGVSSNNDDWLRSRSSFTCLLYMTRLSRLVTSVILSPNLSNAPVLSKASSVFLLNARELTRAKKSGRSINGPPFFLSCTISSAISVPTFLMAMRPQRMLVVPFTTAKPANDSFTSGGNTFMPMRVHSSTSIVILSMFPASEFMSAAMKQAG